MHSNIINTDQFVDPRSAARRSTMNSHANRHAVRRHRGNGSRYRARTRPMAGIDIDRYRHIHRRQRRVGAGCLEKFSQRGLVVSFRNGQYFV